MRSRFFYSDRDVNDATVMPYNFDDIKIKPNDLVTTSSINGAIGKLYDNLLFIVSQSRVPQSIIPRKKYFNQVITTTSTTSPTMTGLTAFPTTDLATLRTQAAANDITKAICGLVTYQSPGVYSGLIMTDDTDRVAMTMFYDNVSGDTTFKSYSTSLDNYTSREMLSAHKIVEFQPDRVMYVLNTKHRVLYKYDMTGLVTDDQSYFDPSTRTAGKLLLGLVGGAGLIDDDLRFANPETCVVTDTGDLYVVDRHDTTTMVKVFDKNINFVKKISVELPADQTIVDVSYIRDRFFALTQDYIFEYSKQMVLLNTWYVKNIHGLDVDEHHKQIVPSQDDENVFYVVTNRNVLKKFVSKPDKMIGKFVFTGRGIDVPAMDIAFVSCVEHDRGEYVYVCDRASGLLYKFDESIDYQKCVNDSFENSFVKLHDIEIKPEEYVNHIVYNKTMTKLFYNHVLVGNSITSKLVADWVDPYKKQYITTRHALPEEIWSKNRTAGLNNFIGINEVVMSSVINRTLKKIYDMQIFLLKDIQLQVLSIRPPETLQPAISGVPWSWDDTTGWALTATAS